MDKQRLERYTKEYGCRYTRRQKNKFLEVLHKEMAECGYESTDIQGKRLFSRANNVLYGNLKQMTQVIVVPYDTPEKRFWPTVRYYPLNGSKTISKSMVPLYVPAIVLFVVLFVGVYLVQPKISDAMAGLLVSSSMFLIAILLIYNLLHGFSNRKNYNRNSAAIACAVEVAHSLSKEERAKTGFLFTDKNKQYFLGAEASANYFHEQHKQPELIVLDCIGKGSCMQIGFNPQNRKLAAELAKHDPSKTTIECVKLNETMRSQHMMAYFKKAVMVACGELEGEDLCVLGTHTGKDTELDEGLLDRVKKMLLGYLKHQS